MRKLTAILLAAMLISLLAGCGDGVDRSATAGPAATASPKIPVAPVGGDWRVMQSYGSGTVNNEHDILYAYDKRDDEWVFYWNSPSQSPLFSVDGSQADDPSNWNRIEFEDLNNDGVNEIVIEMDPLIVLILKWDNDIEDFDFYDEDEPHWYYDGVYRPVMDSASDDVDTDGDIWRANGLPPALDSAPAEDFDESIVSFATVSINQWNHNAGRPYIYIKYGIKDGVMGYPDAFSYGIPQVASEFYIEYLEILYGQTFISNPYDDFDMDSDFDFDEHDPADWFFENELLHRDMVFYVWDGDQLLGTGRIAKIPEFITYSGEVFTRAEFRMDDPSIVLQEDVEYSATTAEWPFYPAEIEWLDSGEFEIDIDGDGLYVEGYTRAETKDSETFWYLDIIYLSREYHYELGDQYDDDLENYVKFMDFDGDGRLEMIVSMELSGGWGEEVVFFDDNKAVTVISQTGSY